MNRASERRFSSGLKLRLATGLTVGLMGVAAAGCATSSTALVNGREVQRLDLAFTGRPYDIRHVGAHPAARSPSSGLKDDGGHISGHVCGLDLLLDVRHEGDHVTLGGFIDGVFSAQIDVRDKGGVRFITGTLGGSAGISMVDLKLVGTGLAGRVGYRVFLLQQDGDRLVGKMRLADTRFADTVIEGRGQLWSMPAADQAAVLATILTCHGGRIENDVRNPLVVTIGGTMGAEPEATSSLYLTPNGF